MNFLKLFFVVWALWIAFCQVAAHFILKWRDEDRLLRHRLAGIGTLRGRPVMRQEDGAPLMYLD